MTFDPIPDELPDISKHTTTIYVTDSILFKLDTAVQSNTCSLHTIPEKGIVQTSVQRFV